MPKGRKEYTEEEMWKIRTSAYEEGRNHAKSSPETKKRFKKLDEKLSQFVTKSYFNQIMELHKQEHTETNQLISDLGKEVRSVRDVSLKRDGQFSVIVWVFGFIGGLSGILTIISQLVK